MKENIAFGAFPGYFADHNQKEQENFCDRALDFTFGYRNSFVQQPEKQILLKTAEHTTGLHCCWI